jgi:hypothetical protein
MQTTGQHCVVENATTLHLQEYFTSLCSLNDATTKRQTTYEDLRMLKSVVRPQDWMLSLDVDSVFFHVPIHPKHRKFFSSHLALPLFVKNKFIVTRRLLCLLKTRPRGIGALGSNASAPAPPYHQVVEFSHDSLPLGWTSSSRLLRGSWT